MNVGLQQTTSISQLFRSLIERLLDVTDYFVYRKKVSLSEGVLLALSLTRTLWYAFAGVQGNAVVSYIGPAAMWVSIFAVLTILHFVAFFSSTTYSRAIVTCLYALVWMFLFWLSVIASFSSPAAPTFAIFAVLSAFIAARLFRESHANT